MASPFRVNGLNRSRGNVGRRWGGVRGNEPGDADASADEPPTSLLPCSRCGGRMIIIETFDRGSTPTTRPSNPIRIDTS
jgi:hypothetical protein